MRAHETGSRPLKMLMRAASIPVNPELLSTPNCCACERAPGSHALDARVAGKCSDCP